MRFNDPELVKHWPKPNFIDPETRGPAVYIINSTFFGLATLAISLRLYARIFVRKWFGLDDALIVVAWACIFTAGDMAAVFWGFSHYMWDRHMWDGRFEDWIPGAKTLFAAKMFWCSASAFIRLSILVLYYRLLEHVQIRKYRWVLHLSVAFVVGIYLCYLGTTIWACVPIEAYFVWPSPGVCINELYADTILSSFNTFSEAFIAALPIPVIYQLRMKPAQRWAVLSLLCLGFLVAVVGSARTYYVWFLFTNDDLTWYAEPHWICAEVEICVAMICSCAPALRAFFGHLATSLRASRDKPSLVPPRKHSISTVQNSGNSRRTLEPKLSTYASQAEILLSRTVDVEGIALDGLGYTVSITAGESESKKSNLSKPWRRSGADVETGQMNWPARTNVSRSGPVDEEPKIGTIEIVERKSLELRESFELTRPAQTTKGKEKSVMVPLPRYY
ncbi:hypothetical protein FKW77_002789 [Venturia effusa]|uniref:Rhodopsin domain-containing protein n=1 Tax=Venturia effusa TaxID=50376 RepID=A0A517LL20_9PEZI|nr:hypothetical protein FKW77_002789 [Venturia effusa]